MRLIFLLCVVILGIYPSSVNAQKWESWKSGYVLWTSAFYNQITNNNSETFGKGGAGGSFGMGYEFYTENDFIIQIGTELSSYYSRVMLADDQQVLSMSDTEGAPLEAYFDFQNISEKQKMINLSIPLLFGHQSLKGIYFYIGGKVVHNLSGKTISSTDVTSRAQYDNIIGDNNDGFLSDMPNHGLKTESRYIKHSIKFNPLFIGTLEAGHVFKDFDKINDKTNYRIALFSEFSLTKLSNIETGDDLIVNVSNTTEYVPSIDSFMMSRLKSSFLNTFFIGIKFSYVFGVEKRHRCINGHGLKIIH